MKLVSVYTAPFAVETLYQLLRARPPEECISHKKMPTYYEHERFFHSKPYASWYLIEADGIYVGSIYLTRRNEIGIHMFPQYRRTCETQAIEALLDIHEPKRIYANINPTNTEQAEVFKTLGFRLIQHTYEKTT